MIIYGGYFEYKTDRIEIKDSEIENEKTLDANMPTLAEEKNLPGFGFAADFVVITKNRKTDQLLSDLIREMQKRVDEAEDYLTDKRIDVPRVGGIRVKHGEIK